MRKGVCWKAPFLGVGGKDDIKINGAGAKAPEDRGDSRETGCQTEALPEHR